MALRDKIPVGKLVVTDRIYGNQQSKEHHAKMALPNLCDSKELANFKARLRCRHETFNGRLIFYRSMSDNYHHQKSKHVLVFEAVCMILINKMRHGKPLFSA